MESTAKKISPCFPLSFMFLRNKQQNIDHGPLLSTSNVIYSSEYKSEPLTYRPEGRSVKKRPKSRRIKGNSGQILCSVASNPSQIRI